MRWSRGLYPWLSELTAQLLPLVARRQLAHGLLIKGGAGLGKLRLSQHLAQALLCQAPAESQSQSLLGDTELADSLPCGQCHSCNLVDAGTHSDLHLINSDQRSIGVDTVRQLCQVLSESPRLGRSKVAIINDADKMTEAAANALLKTLEEPHGQASLILVSAYPERLLPTIRSRCQQWLVPIPAPEQVFAWLSSQELSPDSQASWAGALRVNQGSPLATLTYLQSGRDHARHQLLSQFSQLHLQPQNVMAMHSALLAEPLYKVWLQLLLQDALQLALGLSSTGLRLTDNQALALNLSQLGVKKLEQALAGLLQLEALSQTQAGRPVNSALQLQLWLNDWLAN